MATDPVQRRALEALQELYSSVPTLDCKGLCSHSCVPVQMSRAEAAHIDPGHPERINTLSYSPLGQPRCMHLSKKGTCTVYTRRPMICRVWGASEPMPCPHGCTPRPRPLTATEMAELMVRSLMIGGHPWTDSDNAEEILALARMPQVADLLMRMISGDETAVPLLRHEIHRARAAHRAARASADDDGPAGQE